MVTKVRGHRRDNPPGRRRRRRLRFAAELVGWFLSFSIAAIQHSATATIWDTWIDENTTLRASTRCRVEQLGIIWSPAITDPPDRHPVMKRGCSFLHRQLAG
ncbi:unnamed protein product [Urochloa humidicola]